MRLTKFQRPTDAAKSLGIKPGTYRTYELPKSEGGRAPALSELQRIAKKYGASWLWIIQGVGDPTTPDSAAIPLTMSEVIAKGVAQVDPEKQEDALRAVQGVLDAFAKKTG